MGRTPIAEKAMTTAERQKRFRERRNKLAKEARSRLEPREVAKLLGGIVARIRDKAGKHDDRELAGVASDLRFLVKLWRQDFKDANPGKMALIEERLERLRRESKRVR